MSDSAIVNRLLREAHTVAIAGHVNPDGDSYASVIGLGLALQDAGKQVDMLAEEKIPHFSYLPAFSCLRPVEDTRKYDLFISVDLGDTSRIGRPLIAMKNSRHSINFDHHLSNDGSCDYAVLDPLASSTCEIIASFLLTNGWKVSPEAATALYAGIITDSNRFLYDTSGARTHRLAADLLDCGADAKAIYLQEYQNENRNRIAFEGSVVEKALSLHGGRVMLANITQEWIQHYGLTMPEAEGVVDTLRNLQGVEVAVILKEQTHDIQKVSLRSKEYVNVAEIAKTMGGGGHTKAAGATVEGTNQEVFVMLRTLLEGIERP
ncbi:DHH family phosphoesterase [Murdochiella massiliensis]|uniref:DHH family phosphoesterase n=1 Tax=Murdochiella massiliensis TaxID=1673723 RepID=UPI000831D978|nr:bifunctional oligoribonuclease/PAP phosphatase NrnA [Murdochiella massiliensis]